MGTQSVRGLSLLFSLVLLASSCQNLRPSPADGVYLSASGSSLTLQGGHCVRATISSGSVTSYGETPRTWTASGDIQTSGTFPDYEYSYTDGEVSWRIAATFNTRTDFTASVYIEQGDSKTFAPELHFELQAQ